ACHPRPAAHERIGRFPDRARVCRLGLAVAVADPAAGRRAGLCRHPRRRPAHVAKAALMTPPLDRPGWALDPAPAGDLLSENIPRGSGGAQPPVAADPRYIPAPLPLLWPLRAAVFYVWIALVTLFMGLWWLPKVR